MNVFLEFLRIDLRLLLRDRVGMFWTLVFPALMMVLQMALFGGNALGPVRMAIVDTNQSGASRAYVDHLAAVLRRQSAVKVDLMILERTPLEPVDIALTIPETFGKHMDRGITSRVAWSGKLKDRIVLNAMRGIVTGVTDDYNITASGGHRLVSITIPDEYFGRIDNYTLYLVTGLAGMIALSTGLMGFAPLLVAAREEGMLKMYRAFPIWAGTMPAVWLASRLILALCASALMFALATSAYHLRVDGSPVQVATAFVLFGLGAGSFLALGLLVASLVHSVSTAAVVANLLYFPLLFSGNVIVPISGLPTAMKNVLGFLPLNSLVASVRGLLAGRPDYAMIGYTAVLLLVVTGGSLFISTRRSAWQPHQD
jgi:ABC-2 type transport system permease protein